jgi:hypothetical protein
MWGVASQVLVSQLSGVAAVKSAIGSVPQYLSMDNLKAITHRIRQAISDLQSKGTRVLRPHIANAVDHIGEDAERTKSFLSQLIASADHAKVCVQHICIATPTLPAWHYTYLHSSTALLLGDLSQSRSPSYCEPLWARCILR